ncbi:MAG TPA: hypothetical protein EYP86_04600 [Candidatus Altiarchaeales archaeon]|nr:hypothetical protein [Candidatus Altiarchaeales archaeon]
MPKKPFRTLKFKLDGIKSEDKELLDYLVDEFKKVYDHYLGVIRNTGILSKIELEKKTTITVNRKNVSYPIYTNLLANTRQCARDRAVESVRLYRYLQNDGFIGISKVNGFSVNPKLNWMEGYRIDSNKSVRISISKGVMVYAELRGDRKDIEFLDRALNKEFKFNSAQIVRDGNDYRLYIDIVPNQKSIKK